MLAERLKLLRERKGLTQKQFAKKINTSSSSVAMWETNKREPDMDTIKKFAEFFCVSTDYLLGLTDNPASTKKGNNSLSTEEALQIWATEQSFSKKDLEYLRDTIRLLGNKNKIEEFSSEFAKDNAINGRVIPKFN